MKQKTNENTATILMKIAHMKKFHSFFLCVLLANSSTFSYTVFLLLLLCVLVPFQAHGHITVGNHNNNLRHKCFAFIFGIVLEAMNYWNYCEFGLFFHYPHRPKMETKNEIAPERDGTNEKK